MGEVRVERWRRYSKEMLAVATGLVLVAACGPSAPTVPPGGAELAFTQAAIGVRDNPELGAHVFWTTDDGELREAWSGPDLRSQTAPDDLSVPTGQVAVVLDVDHTHHGTEVVHVAEVDDVWLVQLRGYATAACTMADVVEAEVRLVLVTADEPPTAVEQEIEVLRGCDE